MGIYARHIFPRIMDRSMRRMNDLRSETLAPAHGDSLQHPPGPQWPKPH